MTWYPLHEPVDDQQATDTTARLVCRCGWTSPPVPAWRWDLDEAAEDAVSDEHAAAWAVHYAPLITPPPDQVLQLRRDNGGGWRHYLAGEAVHAGEGLELLLEGGIWWAGRYESAWPPGWDTTGPIPMFHAGLGGPWHDNNTDTSVVISFPLPGAAVLRWPARKAR